MTSSEYQFIEKHFDSPIIYLKPKQQEEIIIKTANQWALDLENKSKGVINSNRGGFQSQETNRFDFLPEGCFELFQKKLSIVEKSLVLLNNKYYISN